MSDPRASQRPSASSTLVCPVHGLRYDASTSSGCIRCRASSRPAPAPEGGAALKWLGALAALILVAAVAWRFAPSLSSLASVGAHAGAVRDLETKNGVGRSGKYYVPALASGAPVPLLVFLHGTGGRGEDGIGAFRALADARHFAILSPESGTSPNGTWNWEVGTNPGEVTADRRHVMACLAEMLAREGLTLDPAHVLVAGHSGGGSSAPYLATNEEPFSAFAVLHGGAFPAGYGGRQVRGWFSTGSADTIRPPAGVTAASDATKAVVPSVEMHVFDGGHALGEDERRAVVDWWLDGS